MTKLSDSILCLVIGSWSSVIHSDSLAASLVPVGTQPHGGLSGKIVYTHGGHGYTAANEKDGAWSFQRGPRHGMIEDLGNVDQVAEAASLCLASRLRRLRRRPIGPWSCAVF